MPLRFFTGFGSRRLRTPQRNRRGTTAVEMALLAPAFFFLLIGMTEMGLILTAQQLIENASFNASRLAKTGYIATGQTQAQTVLQIVTNELSSFGTMFDTTQLTTTATAYNSFSSIGVTGQGTSGYGTEQQIVVYTINYPWKIFTPMVGQIIGTWDAPSSSWRLNLSTRLVVRNEPYS